MRYRLKQTYMCVIDTCPELNKPKVIYLEADAQKLFHLPTLQCLCGWEPKLVHSETVVDKHQPIIEPVTS
jgi:hypothetical protein